MLLPLFCVGCKRCFLLQLDAPAQVTVASAIDVVVALSAAKGLLNPGFYAKKDNVEA